MWRKVGSFTASIGAAALFGGSGMSADAVPSARHCRVIAAEKLTAESGGAAALCAEVERAVGAAVPSGKYGVEVRVLSPARLSATMVVDGRKLPEQNLASSDRNLTPGAVRRFARSLAQAAKTAR